jgi:hypothetical protein
MRSPLVCAGAQCRSSSRTPIYRDRIRALRDNLRWKAIRPRGAATTPGERGLTALSCCPRGQ